MEIGMLNLKIKKKSWNKNTPRTQSLRDRVFEASAELVEAGAPERPPLLPMVAEATNGGN